MNYTDLFTAHHSALLADWLEPKGELCLETLRTAQRGQRSYFTVKSLKEIRQIIAERNSCLELVITIWKNHSQSEFESEDYDPLMHDLKWICAHADEVMYFSVTKKRNWTESYHTNPSRYAKVVEEWAS